MIIADNMEIVLLFKLYKVDIEVIHCGWRDTQHNVLNVLWDVQQSIPKLLDSSLVHLPSDTL